MSDVTSGSDRDPQRKALTDLISRFTADRDRVISAVADCEARLEELVGRVRGHDAGSGSHAPSVPSGELDDVRAAMRELNEEIQTLRARETNAAANTAVRALATESAQTREWVAELRAEFPRLRADVERTATQLREAAEEVRSAVARIEGEATAGPEVLQQRIEHALAPLAEQMRSFRERLAEVEGNLPSAGSTPAVDAGDALAELRAATARVDERIDERTEQLWGRVEALVGPMTADVRALTVRGADAESAIREQLTTATGRLSALAETVGRLERSAPAPGSGASPQHSTTDAMLQRILDEQRRLHEEAATDIARTRGALTTLTGRVGQLEVAVAQAPRSVLSALYDEVRDALRARAEGILHDLEAWLPEVLRLVGRRSHG